mmetsp:Transcript_61645/g.201169  ORF Transcript_61645/g.201169 Transcript_61645/m.201169 type:complete len:218 (+) Transcript_61645:3-656(+)
MNNWAELTIRSALRRSFGTRRLNAVFARRGAIASSSPNCNSAMLPSSARGIAPRRRRPPSPSSCFLPIGVATSSFIGGKLLVADPLLELQDVSVQVVVKPCVSRDDLGENASTVGRQLVTDLAHDRLHPRSPWVVVQCFKAVQHEVNLTRLKAPSIRPEKLGRFVEELLPRIEHEFAGSPQRQRQGLRVCSLWESLLHLLVECLQNFLARLVLHLGE